MKNYTFKVFPTPSGLENNTPADDTPADIPVDFFAPYTSGPCPKPPKFSPGPGLGPCPGPSPAPCPPMMPVPMPPPMPCPPIFTPDPAPCPGAPCPGAPCPGAPCPGAPCPMTPGYLQPQYPGYAAPPFTCPYFRLAHAYVPWQYYNAIYSPAEALEKGTLFPELCMPQGQYGPCEGPCPCRLSFGGGVPRDEQ